MSEVLVETEPQAIEPRGKRRWRLGILVATLAICAAIAVFQRDRLAGIPNSLARSCFVAREDDRAYQWLRRSSWISSRNPETKFLLARYYRRQGRLDDARQQLQQAHDLGCPTDLLQREQWLAMAQAGQLAEAEPFLPQLLADPRDDGPEISEAYVIGYLRARQFSPASLLITAWIQDHPLDPQPHFWRALIERENDHPDQAERALRWALDLKPDHPQAAFLLAEVLSQDKRQDEEAIRYYEIAKRDPEQQVQASTGIAKSLRALGRSADAERELNAALRKFSDSKELVLELSNSLIEQGEYSRALEKLKPLESQFPTDRDVRYALGVAYRGSGNQAEAQKHLEFATEASKELTRAGLLIHKANQNPQDAEIRAEIGVLMLKYGAVKDGIVWLESALQIDPNHHATHQALADYYAGRAKTEGPEYERLAAQHRAKLPPGP